MSVDKKNYFKMIFLSLNLSYLCLEGESAELARRWGYLLRNEVRFIITM